MKQKTKRIIAREGLIILLLILLAVLSSYLASSLNNKKYEYTSNAKEVEVAQQGKPIKLTPVDYDPFSKAAPVSPSVETPQQNNKPKIYKFTHPDGRALKITSHDGSTPNEAELDEILAKYLTSTPQANKKPSFDGIYGVSGNQHTIVELIPQRIIVLFPKDTNKSVIEKTIRKDFAYIDKVDFITHDEPQYKSIDRYYDSEGNRKFDSFIYKRDFFNIALFLFFGAYPLYLLIRFIVWSIKTLKNRTGKNE